jgi:Zn-dependent protease
VSAESAGERASDASENDEDEAPRPARVGLVLALGAVTLISMLYAGAGMHSVEVVDVPTLLSGWDFAIPLMAILLCHELGHYVAGRIRGVDISLPYFIPMPVALLGTMGAVISMRGRIKTRDALFDVGAAGPYAGLVIALPVLVFGIATSPVARLSDDVGSYIFEGHSLLYAGLLYAIHGPFPRGHDISLSATAFAGWAGLLVTMMNLLPVGQLDGGHVGYALLGERHHRFAKAVHYALPVVALITGLYYVAMARLSGYPWDIALQEIGAGVYWLVWFGVLHVIARFSGGEKHPPTDDTTLSPGRRIAAWATLVLFVLLFMPSWIRTPLPPLASVTADSAE